MRKNISYLKMLREKKGLSRKEVSEQSGVNFRSLQDYEQGHKNIASAKGETLYKLSLILGCTMEEILNGVNNEIVLECEQWNMSDKNGDQRYYLMHCNDVVTTLVFDLTSGNIIRIEGVVNKELLPPGGNLSSEELKKWWIRRAVPLNQGKVKGLLSANQIPTTQHYLLQNLGLSLSDHYWINPVNKCYRWEEVNLFANDFRDELGNFCFKDNVSEKNRIIDLKNRTLFYPSASLQGELQKKWVLQNGKRYLIKGNYGISSQQSINEVIASLLHKSQGKMPYTFYILCDIEVDGNIGKGCLCEDFCTEEVEFIPAYDVMNSVKRRNDTSYYEHFINVCEMRGLKGDEVRAFLEYQILSDFVLTNTDRHFYNFGVLRDTRTLKYIGMAPIFDSGNSMFWDKKRIPSGEALLDISVNSFAGKEVELLRYVKERKGLDVEKLPRDEEIRELLCMDEMNGDRVEAVLDAYRAKVELLRVFQSGEKIYKYGYKMGEKHD